MLIIQYTSTLISQNNVPHCAHRCATLRPKRGTFRLDIKKNKIIDIIIYVKTGSKNKHENKPFLVHFSQTLCISHPPGTTFSKKVVPAEKKWYFHKALVHTTNKILTSDFYKNPVPLFFQKVVPAEIISNCNDFCHLIYIILYIFQTNTG